MSKIPQGEWNAIAQRYSQGETISSIARHYGCTPPAIHYILKRVRRGGHDTAEPAAIAVMPPVVALNPKPHNETREPVLPHPSTPQKRDDSSKVQPAPFRQPFRIEAERRSPSGAQPEQNGRKTIVVAQKPIEAARPNALTAELDAALQAHTEAAIEAFRSSFAAALADRSAAARERLRQAASDLMRAAARTTIVLDRVNAPGKQGGPR